jgi:hypothetical protein
VHISYEDIQSRIPDRPLWWFNGVPRFDHFRPQDVNVYTREVALVHTQCQTCGTRFDVAVLPEPHGRDLRTRIAYFSSLEIGDPPLHCPRLDCSGNSMGSLEIAVSEFWTREIGEHWQRDASFERPLTDADEDRPIPIFLQLYSSERFAEWKKAVDESNYSGMVEILVSFGCERPAEVAHMLDVGHREKKFEDEISHLRRERFPKG